MFELSSKKHSFVCQNIENFIKTKRRDCCDRSILKADFEFNTYLNKCHFFLIYFVLNCLKRVLIVVAHSTQLRSQRRCLVHKWQSFGIFKPITCKTKQNINYNTCKCIYISISHKRNSTLKPQKAAFPHKAFGIRRGFFYWIYCSCWRHTFRIIGRNKAAKDFCLPKVLSTVYHLTSRSIIHRMYNCLS